MKNKYTFWLFLLLVFLIMDTGLLNSLYLQTNQYRNTVQDVAKFAEIPANLDLINLGTSHGKFAFEYTEQGIQGFNAALDSQDFYYDRQILSTVLPHLKKGAVVLIPVSYFSFSFNLADSPENFLSQNRKYYHFLAPAQIKNYASLEKLKTKIPVINAGEKIRAIIRDEAPFGYEKIEKNIFGQYRIDKAGQERAEHHMTFIKKGIRPAYVQQLGDLIIQCRQNGLQPLLVTTPFTDSYNKGFSPAFLARFYGEIASLTRITPSLLYLDYAQDARFRDIDLFLDSDHLNRLGRKKFTAIILQDLQAKGIIMPR